MRFTEGGRRYIDRPKSEVDHFETISNNLNQQYNTLLGGGREVTVLEDIADNIGVAMAYEAYKLSLKKEERKGEKEIRDTIDNDKLFYYGWALGRRDEFFWGRINCPGDVFENHSPHMVRVNGPLKNQPGFYKAFGIKQSDRLYLEEAKRIGFDKLP